LCKTTKQRKKKSVFSVKFVLTVGIDFQEKKMQIKQTVDVKRSYKKIINISSGESK
jgi:hypothetical protein